MNKTVFYSMLAVIGALAFANSNSSAKDPKPTNSGVEYLTIQYAGSDNSYALYPDGRAQFFPELANIPRLERIDLRVFLMHTLINKFSKEGYDYVETTDVNRVIMKKRAF